MTSKTVAVKLITGSKWSNHGWKTARCIYDESIIVEGNIFPFPCEGGYAQIVSSGWVMQEKDYQHCYLTFKPLTAYEITRWEQENGKALPIK